MARPRSRGGLGSRRYCNGVRPLDQRPEPRQGRGDAERDPGEEEPRRRVRPAGLAREAEERRADQRSGPREGRRDAGQEPRVARPADLRDEGEVEPAPPDGPAAGRDGDTGRAGRGQCAAKGEERVRDGPDERAGDDARPAPAAEGAVADHAPGEPAPRAAQLGERQELSRHHGGHGEGLLGEEGEIGEHRRLGDGEEEPAGEDHEDGAPPQEDRQLGQARPLPGPGGGVRRGPAVGKQHERAPADRRRSGDRESVPPARRGSERRQRQRGCEDAQREPRLLDPHRHAAPVRREPLDDGPARRRIQDAEAEATRDEAREDDRHAGAQRGEEDHGAREPLAEPEGDADPEAVGEPARWQRHHDAAEVDGRQEQPDLEPGEAERVEEERGERRDRERGERAEGVRERRQREDRGERHQRWRRSVSAASMSVSDRVGWAWIVAARSSTVSAVSTASAPSAISSPAPGPTMPTPRTRPVSPSATSLVSPSARPRVVARPEAAHWNFATLTARPSRCACASVRPHHATSGSVNTTAGTTTLSKATGRPAIASAATTPWRIARWASIGSPVTSPTAQMRGSAVRHSASTAITPRASGRTRVVSRPRAALAGRRPTATSTRSKPTVAAPKRASIPEPVSRSDVTFVSSQIFTKRLSHWRASGWTRSRSTPGRRPDRKSTRLN